MKNKNWQPKVGQQCSYGFGKIGKIINIRGKQWLTLSNTNYELHKDSVTLIPEIKK